jgi:hypothetical protein
MTAQSQVNVDARAGVFSISLSIRSSSLVPTTARISGPLTDPLSVHDCEWQAPAGTESCLTDPEKLPHEFVRQIHIAT